MSGVKQKRNDLSLKMKYEVIKASEMEPKLSSRKLAETFKCGKSQIQGILKNKDHFKTLYLQNANDKMKHCRKRSRQSEYADINEALYEWFQLAAARNIHPGGKILMEKAKETATRIDSKAEFKASNGWLTRWKERYNISQRNISGESGDVRC